MSKQWFYGVPFTGVLIANKPHDLTEARTIAEFSIAKPRPDATFWKVIKEGDNLWNVALNAYDTRKPASHCPAPSA